MAKYPAEKKKKIFNIPFFHGLNSAYYHLNILPCPKEEPQIGQFYANPIFIPYTGDSKSSRTDDL